MSGKNKRANAPPDPAVLSETLSINVMKELVNNLEETKLKLLLHIKELKEKLEQQKLDQSDIYYYLNKKCDESFEVIASLEDQLLNEQADREIAEKMYESKVEEMRINSVNTESKLNSKIVDLENRLDMLNKFSETKDDMEKNLQKLLDTLDAERAQYSKNTENLENAYIIEREKLRKSYEQKFEVIKRDLDNSVEGKLSKKTKKTQEFNYLIKTELEKQSKNAEKLLEINQNILDRDKSLKLELDLANSIQNEMIYRLSMYQRMIKQLNSKLDEAQTNHDEQISYWEKKYKAKNEEAIRLQAKLNKLNKQTSKENSRLDDVWHFLSTSYELIKNKSLLLQQRRVNNTNRSRIENQSSSSQLKVAHTGGHAMQAAVASTEMMNGHRLEASSVWSEDIGVGMTGSVATHADGSGDLAVKQHEKILISLVTEVVNRNPHILNSLTKKQSVDQREGNQSYSDYPSQSSFVEGMNYSSTQKKNESRNRKSHPFIKSHHDENTSLHSLTSNSLGSSAVTGIPAWDKKSTLVVLQNDMISSIKTKQKLAEEMIDQQLAPIFRSSIQLEEGSLVMDSVMSSQNQLSSYSLWGNGLKETEWMKRSIEFESIENQPEKTDPMHDLEETHRPEVRLVHDEGRIPSKPKYNGQLDGSEIIELQLNPLSVTNKSSRKKSKSTRQNLTHLHEGLHKVEDEFKMVGNSMSIMSSPIQLVNNETERKENDSETVRKSVNRDFFNHPMMKELQHDLKLEVANHHSKAKLSMNQKPTVMSGSYSNETGDHFHSNILQFSLPTTASQLNHLGSNIPSTSRSNSTLGSITSLSSATAGYKVHNRVTHVVTKSDSMEISGRSVIGSPTLFPKI